MNVTVQFFAHLSDAVRTESCRLHLAPGASGLEARELLIQRYRPLADWIDCCRLAVNQEYQPWETALKQGDELGLIPPVSGG